MATNDRVTNRSADDGTLYADADPQNILSHRLAVDICSDPISTYYIFSTYDSISMWYNIDDTKAAGLIKRDVILNRVILKHGKTHCRPGIMTDPIAHVTDVEADLE